MTAAQPRTHQWQGTGGNGKAMRIPVIETLHGDLRRADAAKPTPMWLRELRRDTREQVL